LNLLNQEKLINSYPMSNAASEALTQQGLTILTNIRFVWYSNSNENFNISVPWICIKSISKRALKSG